MSHKPFHTHALIAAAAAAKDVLRRSPFTNKMETLTWDILKRHGAKYIHKESPSGDINLVFPESTTVDELMELRSHLRYHTGRESFWTDILGVTENSSSPKKLYTNLLMLEVAIASKTQVTINTSNDEVADVYILEVHELYHEAYSPFVDLGEYRSRPLSLSPK